MEIVVLVMPSDDRVWFDSATLLAWLRKSEVSTGEQVNAAEDSREAVSLLAAGDALRQVREHLTLTQMHAVMTVEARRT